MSQVHIRYEGQSYDVTFDDLDIGDMSSDVEVRNAVASFLNAPANKLSNFAIDRNAEGEITLRPQAVFGC